MRTKLIDTASPSHVIDMKSLPRVLGRLTRLSLRYPWRAALAVIFAMGAAVLNIVTPHLLGEAVDQASNLLSHDRATAKGVLASLMSIGLLIVAASAVRGVFTGGYGYLGENIAQRVGCDLRLAFFEKLQRLSFSYHDRVHSGDLIARGILDLEGVRAFLESGLLRAVTLILLLGVGSWRLFQTDGPTGLVALSFVPFVIWRAARMGALLRLKWMLLQEQMSLLIRAMEENLQGVRVVRAFSAKLFELANFDKWADAALHLSNQRITIRMGTTSIMTTAYYGAMVLVLWVGGHRIAAGHLTVGSLTEILTFMTILQLPLRQVGMIVNSSARAASCGQRLFEVLDLEPAVRDAAGARDLVITEGVLRFENVDFSYDNSGGEKVLTNISFEVRRGKTLGIVGPPGSGKSTIAQLIARFYDIDSGRISIDGQDIRDVTLSSLRRAVALVQQEIFLFDTSVQENVSYADPWVDNERVIEAASVAQIHDHVAGLPKGYRTHVGERGVVLSGGQRQRMSIARGLVANPDIMVFDDATAAIDAITERQIHGGLRNAVGSMATIIIAHRLGSLMHADEIIVLNQGRIVERGTHMQLLQENGLYAGHWRLQNRTEAQPGNADPGPLPGARH